MATFVLVHGSWHGGWCWRKLTPLLRAQGHDVYSPTLTGMGESRHLLNSDTGLAVHIRDIGQLLFYEDLRDAILVGHSYGGSIISAVAEENSDRIARLVYLDAFVPRDGDSLFSMRAADFGEYWRDQANAYGDGWLLQPLAPDGFGVKDPADIAWMTPRLVPVLLSTFTDPVQVPSAAAERLPRSYVYCTESGFGAEAERARSEGWDCYELPTGHDSMVTMPDKLAGILLGIA
jgi:pimeloyl-ACP methyl ester carboxylesterase